MTSMTEEDRNTLVAAMSDKTAMGRLNAGEITACFDRLVELGYDIVKRPVVVEQKAPEPVAAKPPEPPVVEAKPEHASVTTRHRQSAKP